MTGSAEHEQNTLVSLGKQVNKTYAVNEIDEPNIELKRNQRT